MPALLKEIQAEILPVYSNEINSNIQIIGLFKTGTYINTSMLQAYLQDFTQASLLELLEKPVEFGIKNIKNFIELQISY